MLAVGDDGGDAPGQKRKQGLRDKESLLRSPAFIFVSSHDRERLSWVLMCAPR